MDNVSAATSGEVDKRDGLLQERRARVPRPLYPPELPVVEKRELIADAIRDNQVIVLCGETGSGKTTQLPKICLELGRGIAGMIGHTQPRRIAARSIAARLAQELGTTVGEAVGYKIRFSDKVSPATYIKVMTDGILLAETQGDRLLQQYDTIIIDEAHERSLNIDFLLGYLKQLLPQRPDLKLIITSATIDPQRFSEHFDHAPILEISGRMYPVQARYRPLEAVEAEEEDRQMELAILNAVDELWREAAGDVLIFLSGEREIRETAEALRKHHPPDTEILPLYARLSASEQMRIFQPHTKPRIILATNVAETSLTVPGIKYVIDPGHARISRYSPRTKVQRLPIERISRASADQRMGRCGRISEGVCIRLYSEEDYQVRPQFTDPEILRTHLASVILQMKALRLGSVQDFPFLQPPDYRAIRDGYQTLHELGAIDEHNELTSLGRKLAKLPIDPRIGRMVLEAIEEDCEREVLIIAAALSIQDPRERPLDRQEQADEAHKKFRVENSDFLAHLKLWDFFDENSRHLSTSKLRKLCQEHFLSFIRMREWHDIQQQLSQIVSQAQFNRREQAYDRRRERERSPYDRIHRAILAGLLGNIGVKSDLYEYTGARGRKFSIFPGSSLFKVRPPWLVCAELVETTKLYARTAAVIEPRWIEQLAEHLVQRSYSDPHWRRDAGQVIAFEKVTLYGLAIVPRRRVHYGPINPRASRDNFIERALVHGDYATDAQYFRNNRALLRELELIEAKTRRKNVLVDAKTRFAFYDARVPATVYSALLFERWRSAAESKHPRLLFMSRDDLTLPDAPPFNPASYPDALKVGESDLRLEYLHEPGHAADGVTLNVPLAMLNQLRPEQFEWLVPGLLPEKVLALIRSLPRPMRTLLVPAPDVAVAAVGAIHAAEVPLLEALAAQLSRASGTEIPPSAFEAQSIAAQLRMNFRIVDAVGKQLAMGRDLAELRGRLGVKARNAFASLPPGQFNRGGITRWDFGDLPHFVPVRHQQMMLQGFPAIVDEGSSVALRLFDNQQDAQRANALGVLRLFMLQVDREFEIIVRRAPLEQMCLHYATFGKCDRLQHDLRFAIAARAFFPEEADVRSQAQFIERAEAAWRRLEGAGADVIGVVAETLSLNHELGLELNEDFPPLLLRSIDDLREQLSWLMPSDFLLRVPFEHLQHLPRYLKAMQLRVRKLLNAGLARDSQQMEQVLPHWQQYMQRWLAHREQQIQDPALQQYRWMIEELRVSVFAQELKTPGPISSHRLQLQWSHVRA